MFTDEASAPGGTFLLPIIDHGNEVSQIGQDAIQSEAAAALKNANDRP